ncbi:MAG: N-acetylmuramoyl-L-alanine amidase, partial [Elainellaceae cyanobacterium]
RPTPNPTPSPSPAPRPTPSPVSPNTAGPPPPPSDYASRLGFSYRVVVPATSSAIQSRVRAVVPDAFRTTIGGEIVMQAGLFRDRTDAEVLRQRLRIYNLAANILEIAAAEPGTPENGNTPPPSDPPRQPTPTPELPRIPATRTVIVIDPGHGGRDPGAIGRNGLREAPTVMDISLRVQRLLEQQGIQVVMTRTGDVTVDLEPRVAIARRADADLFVSIHANAISMSRPEVNGLETFYYSSREGYQLAQSIQRSMVQSTGMVNRGVKEARFYVIRNTPMPAVLVETGFVTGANDAPRLADPNFRQQMAEAIAQGIFEYLR